VTEKTKEEFKEYGKQLQEAAKKLDQAINGKK
jgi:hypothetical protein